MASVSYFIDSALLKCGAKDIRQPSATEYQTQALATLRSMLMTWSADERFSFLTKSTDITIATDGVMPDPGLKQIHNVYFLYAGGNKRKLRRTNVDDFDMLRAQGGDPTHWLETMSVTGTASVETHPPVKAGQKFKIRGHGGITIPTLLTDTLLLPDAFDECVIYNLAARLFADLNIEPTRGVLAMAGETYQNALMKYSDDSYIKIEERD